jgi:hypothetical protein
MGINAWDLINFIAGCYMLVGLQGSCILSCISFCILTPNYDFGVADDYSALLGYSSAIEPYEGSLQLT